MATKTLPLVPPPKKNPPPELQQNFLVYQELNSKKIVRNFDHITLPGD